MATAFATPPSPPAIALAFIPRLFLKAGHSASFSAWSALAWGLHLPEMAIVKSSLCRYVHITDEQAARTIGTVALRGRSLTRAHHAFLSHLRAAVPVRL
jgi:hypothetical protein